MSTQNPTGAHPAQPPSVAHTWRGAGLLTGDMERDSRNVSLLLEAVNRIASEEDVSLLTARVVDMTVELTRAQRGLLLIQDAEGNITPQVGRDQHKQPIALPTAFSSTVASRVFTQRRALCVVDTLTAPYLGLGESVTNLDLRTIMCVPVMDGDQLLAALYVDSRIVQSEFNDADLRFFEAICQQAGLAIQTARHRTIQSQQGEAVAMGEATGKIVTEVVAALSALDAQADRLAQADLPPAEQQQMSESLHVTSQQITDLLRSIPGLLPE